MRRAVIVSFVFILILGIFASASADYSLGAHDKKILQMKNRMKDLGYFSGKQSSDVYNEKMAEKVKIFQTINGMEPTGQLDDRTVDMIFSEDARSCYDAPLMTEENRKAFVIPDTGRIELADDGDPSTPVIYQDRKQGYWLYEAAGVRIEIKRIEWPDMPLIWFETDVCLSDGNTFFRMENKNKKGKLTDADPRKIAKDNNAVFGISDDFASYRINGKAKPGIIIRNKQVLSNDTHKKAVRAIPNLDVLALFEDGSMKTFDANQYKAQDYLDMGVTDTFTFGPYMLREGRINPDLLLSGTNYRKLEPRNAMGMIEPGHYVFVTTLGRQTKSGGTYISWLAYRMKDLGCVEALNLDGGNTIALIFMGDMINKSENAGKSAVRTISSLIGAGIYIKK